MKKNPNQNEIPSQKKILKGYNLQQLHLIYVKFLKIINYIFDGNSTLNELPFLSDIISAIEVPKILRKLDLELNLRIEILKFFRS